MEQVGMRSAAQEVEVEILDNFDLDLANNEGDGAMKDQVVAEECPEDLEGPKRTRSSRRDSRASLSNPMQLEHIKKLSGFFTGTSSPDYVFVDSWFWAMRGGGRLMVLMLVLNWGISWVLAATGLSAAWLYHEVFDWSGNFEASVAFGIIGGIFTGWNIAQYASFAIQTTGHLTFMQHLRAMVRLGPVLLPCNLTGWLLGYLVVATPLVGLPMPIKIVIIAAVPIASGIAVKTFWKLYYFKTCSAALDGEPKDSLGKRLRLEEKATGKPCLCPFQSITCKLWFQHFMGPFTCFLWTVVYVLGLRLGYVWADSLDEVAKAVVQGVLFTLSLFAMAAGMKLLTKWVQASQANGFFGYNHQMLVAFVVIYGSVSEVQVRLGLVKMGSWMRLVCSFIQPFYFSGLRYFMVRDFKKADNEETSVRLAKEPWLVITCMGTLVTQNVCAVLLAGVACLFQDLKMFSFGECEYGFWTQMVMDAGFTWLGDVLTIAQWIKMGMPVLYFFSMLDAFLVIAAILVVYVCTILGLLTACISF